jgi:hypothetical protein
MATAASSPIARVTTISGSPGWDSRISSSARIGEKPGSD